MDRFDYMDWEYAKMKWRDISYKTVLPLLLGWLSIVFPAHGAVFSYAPSKVLVTGTIIVVRTVDAPGFGESPRRDNKIEVPVLLLKEPISVKPQAGDQFSDPVSNIRRIQIIDPLPYKYRPLCGQSVKVEGTLEEAATANFVTKVTLNIDRILSSENSGNCKIEDQTRGRVKSQN